MTARLRLCILGCGDIARTHARILTRRREEVELLFASRSPERAAAYARQYGGRAGLGSYEEACRRQDLDAVLICTPHHLHRDLACLALAEGRHVIVEKPMARSIAEVRAMNRAASDSGRRLLVAENYRYRPSVQAVLPMLAAGDLGVLKYLRIHVLSRRSQAQDRWRGDLEVMGGGPFIDGGIHWVHLLLTYGGGATRLFAQRAPHTDPSVPGEDTMTVLCRCANGMVATLIYSKGIAGTYKRKLHALHGSEGTLYLANNGLLGIMRGRRRSFRLFPVRDREGFGAMWSDLVGALRTGGPALVSGLDGALDVAFVERAYESADTGEARSLPPLDDLR